MLITTTNILSSKTPTVTEGASLTGTPEDVVNQDFSLNYTSSSKSVLTFDFGATTSINYVAVAGITNATSGNGSVTILNGSTSVATATIVRNNCVVLSFVSQPFANLRIRLSNLNSDLEPTLSYAAAGTAITIPNGGETSGYGRSWLARGIKSKTTTNQVSAPIAAIRAPMALKGNLNLPDMTAVWSQVDYQNFLDFAVDNLFFINEDETLPQSSYCCYEITAPPPKTHSQTRSLNNVAFGFKVFNGL